MYLFILFLDGFCLVGLESHFLFFLDRIPQMAAVLSGTQPTLLWLLIEHQWRSDEGDVSDPDDLISISIIVVGGVMKDIRCNLFQFFLSST